jgi:hypothetical protein
MMKHISTAELLHKTTQLCLSRKALVSTGVILFGVLSAGAALYTQRVMATPFSVVMQAMQSSSFGTSIMQAESGGTDAIMRVILDAQTNSQVGLEALDILSSSLMPIIRIMLINMLITFCITFISSVYFLLAAVPNKPSVLKACVHVWLHIPAVIVIFMWSSVRSFAWVPVIGPIIGLIVYPRFLLAPVIHVATNKGAFASVQQSYADSKGHAWYILSAFSIVSTITSVLAFVIIALFAFTLDPIVGQYSVIIRSILWQIALAYTVVSLVVLWMQTEDDSLTTA